MAPICAREPAALSNPEIVMELKHYRPVYKCGSHTTAKYSLHRHEFYMYWHCGAVGLSAGADCGGRGFLAVRRFSTGGLHSAGHCSLSAVRNQEGPLVGGYLHTIAIVISISATAGVLYVER